MQNAAHEKKNLFRVAQTKYQICKIGTHESGTTDKS